MWMDILDGGPGPKRGDIVQTTVRTYLVLRSRRIRRKDPSAPPRYGLWMVRWWQLEPDMRQRLGDSAARRADGQRVYYLKWYPRKKKTFENYMKRGKQG